MFYDGAASPSLHHIQHCAQGRAQLLLTLSRPAAVAVIVKTVAVAVALVVVIGVVGARPLASRRVKAPTSQHKPRGVMRKSCVRYAVALCSTSINGLYCTIRCMEN